MELILTGSKGFCGRTFAATVAEKTNWMMLQLSRSDWDIRKSWPYPDVPSAKYFVHFASNVQARQSIDHPEEFIADNILGTFNVLELARKVKPELFVYISSAEVLGGCDEGYLEEDAPLRPSNPYAATKGAGELLTYSYFRSYGLPAIIVRTQGVWGMDQTDPTKFVPMITNALLNGETVKLHTKEGCLGSRQWIEATEFSKKLLMLLVRAIPGETYHIVGEEKNNLKMAREIAAKLKMPLKYGFVEQSATHTWRYAIESTK